MQKTTNIRFTLVKLSYGYHLHILYKENVNFSSRSKIANKLTMKLSNIMGIYRENL